MVKWTQNARKPMQIGKEISAKYKESTVQKNTSYKWGADHPVTVDLPGYQA